MIYNNHNNKIVYRNEQSQKRISTTITLLYTQKFLDPSSLNCHWRPSGPCLMKLKSYNSYNTDSKFYAFIGGFMYGIWSFYRNKEIILVTRCVHTVVNMSSFPFYLSCIVVDQVYMLKLTWRKPKNFLEEISQTGQSYKQFLMVKSWMSLTLWSYQQLHSS